MAASASRHDSPEHLRSERIRLVNEYAQEIQASPTGILNMIGYGTLEVVVVNNHVTTIRIIESVKPAEIQVKAISATA